MLVPAILYKEQITKEFQKLFYTEDMMFETGGVGNWCPEIKDCPEDYEMQFAIVSKDKLIGYLGYYIDWYVDKAYNFGLISFDKGNPVIGASLFDELERLVKTHHRVEWSMVGGNPVEKSYDRFCEKHGGKKHILKDAIKDAKSNYRDDVIYEIVTENK